MFSRYGKPTYRIERKLYGEAYTEIHREDAEMHREKELVVSLCPPMRRVC